MNNQRLWIWPAGLLAIVAGLCGAILFATVRNSDAARVNIRDMLDEVGIEPQPNAQVPLDVQLSDENGAPVRLSDLMTDKPVILALVYFRCPMLCNMTMQGMVDGLSRVPLDAGRDFTVLTVSFDPREIPALAAASKQTALARYGRPQASSGWRFLTGEDGEVRRLADAVGFHYQYDSATDQYAHAAGVVVLTPQGVVSRYLYGVDFSPRDLRLALVDASSGQVGSATDRVLLLCYHYDPANGKYGLAVMRILRLGGLATIVGLALGIGLLVRRERKLVGCASPIGDSVPPTKEREAPFH